MAATVQLGTDELLTTTRSVRRRLDLDRAVDLDVVRECLELALQAPSGSNSQGWQFVVVTDPELRGGLAALYRQAFEVYETMPGNAGNVYGGSDETRLATQTKVMDSARHLAEVMDRVPVLLVPCVMGRVEQAGAPAQSAVYGSILPAVWSFMLAARSRGLGSAWTTLHLLFEEQAAELLGIPFAEVTQTALIPVAHTVGDSFRPAHREPLDTVLHLDRW